MTDRQYGLTTRCFLCFVVHLQNYIQNYSTHTGQLTRKGHLHTKSMSHRIIILIRWWKLNRCSANLMTPMTKLNSKCHSNNVCNEYLLNCMEFDDGYFRRSSRNSDGHIECLSVELSCNTLPHYILNFEFTFPRPLHLVDKL